LHQPLHIELRHVSKEYRIGGARQRVLAQVDLVITHGEFVSIVGPSGSGKTTLAHILGGLTTPTEGELFVDGKKMSRLRDRKVSQYRNKRVGFVFQHFGLLPHYTALENATLPLVLAKMSPRERTEVAAHALRAVGLSKRLDSYASQLSGGERQRVAIARALVNKPDILIADEPTGSLDSHQGEEIAAMLQGLHAQYNITLIVVTHNPEIAARASRVLHLFDGKIVKDTPHAVR
jgi:putative ABC transport system ATP-binding protein